MNNFIEREENQSVQIEIQLVPDDLWQYNKHFLLKSYGFVGLYICSIVVLLSILIQVVFSDSPPNFIVEPIFPSTLFGVILILPLFIYFSSKKSFKRSNRLSEKQIYSIDKTSLSLKGETYTTFYTLDKIHKMSETNRYIYIWETKRAAFILPKRFMSVEDIDFLRALKKSRKIKN